MIDMFDEDLEMKEEYVEKYTEEAKTYLRKHLKEEYNEMMANHPDAEHFKHMGDSELETFLEDIEKRIFMNEEEAGVWLEEQYEQIAQKRQYPTRHPVR